jgi:hypothetical protein
LFNLFNFSHQHHHHHNIPSPEFSLFFLYDSCHVRLGCLVAASPPCSPLGTMSSKRKQKAAAAQQIQQQQQAPQEEPMYEAVRKSSLSPIRGRSVVAVR